MKKEFLNLPLKTQKRPPLVLCLGYFDGLHIGHQQLIKKAMEIGRTNSFVTALMTFDPSPDQVLGKATFPHVLTSIDDREILLRTWGLDQLLVLPFSTELAHLSREQFIEKILLPLNVKAVVCGFDFHYGFRGEGSALTLENDSKNRFMVEIIPPIEAEGSKISSTRIHELLLHGDVGHVTQYLGRPYQLTGIVQKGLGNGEKIGYPTANLKLVSPYEIPRQGVYATLVKWKEKTYGAMTNVGIHPTVQPLQNLQIEVHIFDLKEALYGEKLVVEFLEYIRPEKKFGSLSELSNQLKKDENSIRSFLDQYKPNKIVAF